MNRACSAAAALALLMAFGTARAQTAPAGSAPPAPAQAAAPAPAKGDPMPGADGSGVVMKQGNVTVRQDDPLTNPELAAQGKAPKVYYLKGFGLSGSSRVNTDAIIATLPQKPGDKITPDEVKADIVIVEKALQKAHVHGTMTTMSMAAENQPDHVWVLWDIHLLDALTGAPHNGAKHFVSQTFVGNKKLDAATLAAATELKPDEFIGEGRLSDARTGIEQAYDKVFPGADVQAHAKAKITKDHGVIIEWMINEPKS
jgi:outer membrane protein assembly factor BamA